MGASSRDTESLLSWRFPVSKVRLVTGSASGLGSNIAEAVLAAGDRLVAQRAIHNGLKILWRSTAIGFAPPAWTGADEDAAYAAVKVAVDVNRRPLGLAG